MVHHSADLPDWLRVNLEQYIQRRIVGCTAHQAETRARHDLSVLSRTCRWLVLERNWQQLDSLKRVDLLAYVHHREGAAAEYTGPFFNFLRSSASCLLFYFY